MNQIQSPPYRHAEIAHNAIKIGSMGIILRFGKKFLRGGRKTKQHHEHKQQQPTLPAFSMAVIRLQIEPLIIYNFTPELYKPLIHHLNGKEK